MSILTEAMMQPGEELPWQLWALCREDLRFTGDKPDEELEKELGSICTKCTVFTECLEWAESFTAGDDHSAGAIEVFAAGEWREGAKPPYCIRCGYPHWPEDECGRDK
jgi:hypothetical protein